MVVVVGGGGGAPARCSSPVWLSPVGPIHWRCFFLETGRQRRAVRGGVSPRTWLMPLPQASRASAASPPPAPYAVPNNLPCPVIPPTRPSACSFVSARRLIPAKRTPFPQPPPLSVPTACGAGGICQAERHVHLPNPPLPKADGEGGAAGMDARSCRVVIAEQEEEEKLQSSSPTSLHQPPVGRRAAEEEEDAEEKQGQADAHDGACCRAGGLRLRVLAWGEDGCHWTRPSCPGKG